MPFNMKVVVAEWKGFNMGLARQRQIHPLEGISDCIWEWSGEGDKTGSRKTKTRERSATPVQVRAGEPLILGSDYGEELSSRDTTQEIDATRPGNQTDFGVREKVKDKAQFSGLSKRMDDSIAH